MSILDFPSVPTQRRPVDDHIDARTPATGDAALPMGVAVLLARADGHLRDAGTRARGADRYVAAHLAALRAAAAVVVVRRRPLRDERVASVWRLLADAAPELSEWAEFFAAGTGRRGIAESGSRRVSAAEADALVERAEEFVAVVRRSLSEVTR